MRLSIQKIKLFKAGLYASPLIGILSITPIFIIKEFPLGVFPKAVVLIALATFSVWWLNILLIYLSERFTNYKFLKISRYILSYIFSVFFIMLALSMFKLCFIQISSLSGITPPHSPYASFVMGLSINTIVLIIQDLILLRERKVTIEIENTQLIVKNIEAVNQQLKQQIHPHFLFNSLNTLKSLIKKSPDSAEDFLVKLSDFLRTSISAGKENIVTISSEIKLCLDYLEMQKIRYGNALQFSLEIPKEIYNNGFIPVFSLQLLVENAIKHNALTNESPLQIKIFYIDGRITVSNNLQPKLSSEVSTGFGLTNLTERYKILSGDDVLIESTNELFAVSIKILENENSNNRR